MRCDAKVVSWVGPAFLILVTAEAVVAAEPGLAPAVKVTEKDSGGKVALVKGQELVVSVGFRSGTGYTWQVSQSDRRQLEQVGEPKVERASPARPGGPGRQVFRFRALSPGESTLELQYRRPFEKEAKPARTFQIAVTIRARE